MMQASKSVPTSKRNILIGPIRMQPDLLRVFTPNLTRMAA